MIHTKQRPLSLAGLQRAENSINLKRTIDQISPRVKIAVDIAADIAALLAVTMLILAGFIRLI